MSLQTDKRPPIGPFDWHVRSGMTYKLQMGVFSGAQAVFTCTASCPN